MIPKSQKSIKANWAVFDKYIYCIFDIGNILGSEK